MKNFSSLYFKVYVFGFVFIISWILGALRFQWDFISIIYGILNFPFGVLFLYLDNYLWTNYPSSSLLNNEFVGVLIGGITVLLQSVIYYSLFKKIKTKWYQVSR